MLTTATEMRAATLCSKRTALLKRVAIVPYEEGALRVQLPKAGPGVV